MAGVEVGYVTGEPRIPPAMVGYENVPYASHYNRTQKRDDIGRKRHIIASRGRLHE